MLPSNIKILILIFGFFGGIKASPLEALYQPSNSLNSHISEIEFWNSKVFTSSSGFVHLPQLAAVKQTTFGVNGNIQLLIEAERHLLQALDNPAKNKVPIMCALASNYISQHRFCDALDVMNEANMYDYDRRMIDLLLFDIYLELGWEKEAEHQLHTIGFDRNFDYLIRRAKWEDGNGRLDLAVRYLERARDMAERSKQPSQLSWIYSNLGDFYGHQGNLKASEASFQQALAMNPADAHSYKGLAWIQYSEHGNMTKAMDMLDKILEIKSSPDILLLKAQVYQSMDMPERATKLEMTAYQMMNDARYGRMYQLPLAHALAEQKNYDEALSLAVDEVDQRPTPETFAAMCNILWQANKKERALLLANEYVIGKTVEPKALLNILPVIMATNHEKLIVEELAGTRFELGPVLFQEYQSYLST